MRKKCALEASRRPRGRAVGFEPLTRSTTLTVLIRPQSHRPGPRPVFARRPRSSHTDGGVHGDTSLALTSYLPTLTPQSLSTQSSHTPSAASTRSRSECHTDTRRRACIHDPSSTVPDPQRYVPPPAYHPPTTRQPCSGPAAGLQRAGRHAGAAASLAA